jgi:hypothetical protein
MTRIDRTPKAEPPPRRRRRWLLLLLLFLLLGWWIWPDGRLAKARELRNELFTDSSLSPEERRDKFGALRKVTGQLTDAQRAELAKDSMKRREEELRKYTQLPPDEKKKRLDKDIDGQEQRRQRNQNNPGGAGQGGPGIGAGGGPGGRGGPNAAEDRENRRKERLDDTTPEYRDLRDQYRRDMNARRAERGLPPMTGRPTR